MFSQTISRSPEVRGRTWAESDVMAYLVPVARVMFSLIFIMSSFGHFSDETIRMAASRGVPLANILVPISGVLSLVGGLSVALGFKARWGALLLALFLVPVTLMMHNFWAFSGEAAHMQQIQFMKNLALLGGAILIGYFGSGPVSLDARR